MNAKCPTNDRNHKPLSMWRIKAGGLLIFTLGIHMVTNPNRVLNFGETSKYDSLIWLGNTFNRTLGTNLEPKLCIFVDHGIKARPPGLAMPQWKLEHHAASESRFYRLFLLAITVNTTTTTTTGLVLVTIDQPHSDRESDPIRASFVFKCRKREERRRARRTSWGNQLCLHFYSLCFPPPSAGGSISAASPSTPMASPERYLWSTSKC